MCLMKPRLRQIGERFGALRVDDRAVGRQITADVALVLERFHHVQDVLAHEDLAAGQAHLQSVVIREGPLERLERQFLAPLAVDVQQRAHVAELTGQIAPHGGFIDHALRQASGLTVPIADELLDQAFVAVLAVAGQQARDGGQPPSTQGDGLPQPGDEIHSVNIVQGSRPPGLRPAPDGEQVSGRRWPRR